jgi:hypothetical protein
MDAQHQALLRDCRQRVLGAALVIAAAACTTTDPDGGTDACGVPGRPDCAEAGSDVRPDAGTDPVDVTLTDAPLDLTAPPDVTHPPDAMQPVDVRPDTVQRCGDATAPSLCFQKTVEGLCSDIVFMRAYCAYDRWTCPTGYSFYADCPCGIPPKCLPDSGGDRDGASDADGSD